MDCLEGNTRVEGECRVEVEINDDRACSWAGNLVGSVCFVECCWFGSCCIGDGRLYKLKLFENDSAIRWKCLMSQLWSSVRLGSWFCKILCDNYLYWSWRLTWVGVYWAPVADILFYFWREGLCTLGRLRELLTSKYCILMFLMWCHPWI